MKQIWPNYSYSPATNVLTLTGLNIDRDQLLLVTAADRGRIMYNFADSSVTASAFTSGANTALTLVATTAGLTTTAALVIYYDDQLASTTVTVSSLPAISGTVTVGQIQGYQHTTAGTSGPYNADIILVGEDIEAGKAGGLVIIPAAKGGGVLGGKTAQGDTPICVYGDNGSAVTISGTVTIGSAIPAGTNRIGVVTIGGGTVTIGAGTAQIGSVTANINSLPTDFPTSIANGLVNYTSNEGYFPVSVNYAEPITGTVTLGAGTAQIGSVTASISGTVPVSGTFWQATQPVSLASTTVTISANPAGPLTTRFGSVTTANTSQLTAAVTNTAREYLFIQNISTGSVTVGVGFSPTTTQGIQLSPGSGITFDSFCPTGAVWWLGATTGSAWTILEG